jgi:hypothetical protein
MDGFFLEKLEVAQAVAEQEKGQDVRQYVQGMLLSKEAERVLSQENLEPEAAAQVR